MFFIVSSPGPDAVNIARCGLVLLQTSQVVGAEESKGRISPITSLVIVNGTLVDQFLLRLLLRSYMSAVDGKNNENLNVFP